MGSRARLIELVTGTGLALIGAVVCAGWFARLALLLQPLPEMAPMSVASAVCVLACGAILITPASWPRVRAGWISVVLGISGAVLFERVSGVALPIDLPALHQWLQKDAIHPGRMSATFALALVAAMLVFVLAERQPSNLVTRIATSLAGVVGAAGAVTAMGYVLDLHMLYPDYFLAKMSPYGALALLLLCTGLFARLSLRGQFRSQLNDQDRITLAAAAVLGAFALFSGMTIFALMEQQLASAFKAEMLLTQRQQVNLVNFGIESSVHEAGMLAMLPALVAAQRRLQRRPEDAAARDVLQKSAASFVVDGYSGVRFYSTDGRLMASAGLALKEPPLRVKLTSPRQMWLVWFRSYLLAVRLPMTDAAGVAGYLEAELPVEELDTLMSASEGMGRSGEIGLCANTGETLSCFPNVRRPRVYQQARIADNARRPMGLALSGLTGVLLTKDYRKQHVLAAHSPVGTYGLGLVLKMDTEEVFAPIRDRLGVAALLLLAMIAVATLLLRRLIHPLTARLVRSQELARQNAADAEEHRTAMQAVVENVSDGIVVIERNGTIRGWNAGAARVFGYGAEEVYARNFAMLLPEENRAAFAARIARFARTGTSNLVGKGVFVREGRHKSGRVFDHEFSVNEMQAVGNSHLVMICRDVSERRLLEMALKQSETRLRVITDNMPALIGYIDSEHVYRFNSAAYEGWLGMSRLDITGRCMLDVLGATRYERVRPYLVRSLAGERVTFENEFKLIDGVHQVESIFIPDTDDKGGVRGVYALTYDITRQKSIEAQLTQLARYDNLTGLANRSHFNQRLQEAQARSKREGTGVALMYLDIDKFKHVNDTYGHGVGDGLLKLFARRIEAAVRETDFVSRLGGDEFTVILEGVGGEEDASHVAARIIAAMAEPAVLGETRLTITTSIGIAVSRGAHESAEELNKRADAALYHAKAAGRNNYQFAPSLAEAA